MKYHSLKNFLPSILTLLLFTISSILTFYPIEETFVVNESNLIHAWRNSIFEKFYLLILAITFVIPYLCTKFTKRIFPPLEQSSLANISRAIVPLLWTLPCVFLSYSTYYLGTFIASLTIPLGFCITISLTLDNLFTKTNSQPSQKLLKRISIIGIAIYFIFSLSYYISEGKGLGNGGGDVKHYRIIRTSLLEEGSLELSRELDDICKELNIDTKHRDMVAGKSHIKKNKYGQYYSYHSFGLPILSLPFSIFGDPLGILICLAIISAFAMAGCQALALRATDNKKIALCTTWLLVLSCAWIFTGISFLPEMLGICLTVWSIWGLLAVEDKNKRITATIVTAFCAGALPYAHIRFAPISLLVSICFGIEMLFFVRDIKISKRIMSLIPYGIIYAILGFTLLYFHTSMYAGNAAYNYEEVFLGHPVAMWLILCAKRSLGSVMPCILLMIAAIPYTISRGGRNARLTIYCTTIFFGILLSCCSTKAALEGACIPGRYLSQALPVLLPVIVIALSNAKRIARCFYYAVALLPVLAFFVMGHDASKTSGSFIRLPEKIFNYASFENLPLPFATTDSSSEFILGSIFVALIMILFSIMLFLSTEKRKKVLLSSSAIIGISLAIIAYKNTPINTQNHSNGLKIYSNYYKHFVTSEKNIEDTFRFFNDESFISSSGMKSNDNSNKYFFDYKKLKPNDWNGRNLRWANLFRAFIRLNENGSVAVRVKGNVTNGTALFQFRQGSYNIGNEISYTNTEFDSIWIIPIRKGKGFTNCHFTIKNPEATLTIDEYEIIPFNKYFNQNQFKFPKTSTISDLR